MAYSRRDAQKRRHYRVRQKVSGTSERPRLSVFRSLRHIYAQLIDDSMGSTLVAASTVDREIVDKINAKSKKEQATLVGQVLAARAKSTGITEVVFDRGGYKYHGRVKALADAAREAGLRF